MLRLEWMDHVIQVLTVILLVAVAPSFVCILKCLDRTLSGPSLAVTGCGDLGACCSKQTGRITCTCDPLALMIYHFISVSFMVVLRHISVALSAAMAAVGTALFLTLNLFYKRRMWTLESEYYSISEEQEERSEKQVLVLGLDGAGKSSVLQGLSGARRCCRPTRGFNFISIHTPACQLDFLEIGGGEDLRKYWKDYLKRTHILVYVVDSSDRGRLPQAKDELHRLLKAGMDLPVVVLGNKQDKPNVCSVPELREALSLNAVDHQMKIFLLGSDGLSKTSGLQKLQDLLLTLV